MPVVAALLERRSALITLRRALPGRPTRVLTARSPAHLATLLGQHLVDAVVIGAEAARGPAFSALRAEYGSLPVVLFAPVRSDDAGLLRRIWAQGIAGVLVEGIDDPVVGRIVRRSGLTARREDALLPLAGRLDLHEPLQLAAWGTIIAEAPTRLGTGALAKRHGVARETLSRRFAAGRAPSLKDAIDAVRLVAAGQLLGSAGYRVTDAARLLGYSSVSLLQRSSRRLAGVPAGALGALPPDRILARLGGTGRGRWT